jgi:calmodulin
MRFDFNEIVQEEVEDDDPEKNELREAFNAFDEDGSGSVSTDELRKMLRRLGKSVTNDELVELIKFSDEDNSG